jgi:transcription antitermination factor NusG
MATLSTVYSSAAPFDSIVTGNWYAIQTSPRHEKAVASHLQTDGIECLLPLMVEEHKWSDRRKSVSLPLFPGYVFVQLHRYSWERLDVLRRPGVVRFVGSQREAAPIPLDEIESVRRLVETKIPCRPHQFLTLGQRVRIRSGALSGLEGILLRVTDNDTLVLSISFIQRSLSLRVEGYDFEFV